MRLVFAMLLLAHSTSDLMGQSTPAIAASSVVDTAGSSADGADKEHRLNDELQARLAARDILTEKIQHLRELTGQHEQVLVYVAICELSLTKVQKANVIVNGVDAELLKKHGIRGVLDSGILDEHNPRGKARIPQPENGGLGYGVIDRKDLLSELMTALKRDGALKVLAEPVLATTSGKPASFRAGGEFPVPVPQPDGKPTIDFKKFGTQVDCVPTVLGNGRIHLEVRPCVTEIDTNHSIVVGDMTIPGIRTRQVDTAVEMKVGQTLVLAGLLQKRGPERAMASGVDKPTPEESREPLDSSHEAIAEPAEPNEKQIEEIELVVTVRTELVDAPEVARGNTTK